MENEIYELKKEDAKYYKSLGKAICHDVYHGIFLASRHEKDFWQRVYGYVILKNDGEAEKFIQATGEQYIAVEFYEQSVIEDIDERDIPLLFWFHESGGFSEKLSDKAREKVNKYIREHPEADMWEI